MPSSRTESTLAQIAVLYSRAITEVEQGDIDSVGSALREVEGLLGALGPPEDDSEVEALGRRSAREALELLTRRIADEREQTLSLLGHARRGRRVLSTYGNRQQVVGTRVQHDL